MDRAKKEAVEETVVDDPLLSETLKQFVKEQPGLKKLAYKRFDNLRREKKKDEATAAMLQLGKSVSAKQITVPAQNVPAAAYARNYTPAKQSGPIHTQTCR